MRERSTNYFDLIFFGIIVAILSYWAIRLRFIDMIIAYLLGGLGFYAASIIVKRREKWDVEISFFRAIIAWLLAGISPAVRRWIRKEK
jgi:uncharacterized membrane protein YjjP (DUF1212 family)